MSLRTILRKGTNQTIPGATFTDVEWTTVLVDEGGFYDADKPAEIVIPAATYDYVEVMYDVSWDTNFSFDRYMALLLDGSVPPGAGAHTYQVTNLERGRHCIKCLLPIASGGILKVQVWQNSGSNRELVAGNTPIFAVRLFSTDLPLQPPANLQATAVGTDQIDVTWDAVAGADGYEIEIDSGSPIDVGNVLLHEDIDLDPGTTRSYRVRAYQGSPQEFSDWAGPVEATTESTVAIPARSVIVVDMILSGEAPELGAPPVADTPQLFEDAAGIYSLRKVRSEYAGSAIQVRRTNDNATQDIGFVGNDLDTASLLSFVGANDGRVVRWYDQSGNNRNHVQTDSNTRQPFIVTAGVLETINDLPAIRFGTGNNFWLFIVSSDMMQNVSHGSIFTVGKSNDASATVGYPYYLTNNSTSGARFTFRVTTNNNSFSVSARNVNSDPSDNLTSTDGVGTTHFQLSALVSYIGQTARLYKNGTLVASDDEFLTQAANTSNTASNTSTIGTNSIGNNPFPGNLQEIILFTTDQADNRSLIEQNQIGYWK